MSREDSTMVLGSTDETARVQVPSTYDMQVARLRSMEATEHDCDGSIWQLYEGQFPDATGLICGPRYAHLWRVVESPVEAFDLVAPRMIAETGTYGFNLLVMEMDTGMWLCQLEAKEKRK